MMIMIIINYTYRGGPGHDVLTGHSDFVICNSYYHAYGDKYYEH